MTSDSGYAVDQSADRDHDPGTAGRSRRAARCDIRPRRRLPTT
jgi:hypothetical protein